MDSINMDSIVKDYQSKYNEFGYSPASLLDPKGKNKKLVRFDVLTSQYSCAGKRILDIGCGFGDLNLKLASEPPAYYLGVDMVPEFIEEAKIRYGRDNIEFLCCDYLKHDFDMTFDYAFVAGAFNLKIEGVEQYDYVEKNFEKTYNLVKDGFAFDFMSDKVDYELDHAFHYSPSRILDLAYRYSRNVMLRNDYMPFEFSVFVNKNDSFLKEDTLFLSYKEAHS